MYDQFQQNKLFRGLDGLRFISISAVVWHHSVGFIEGIPITRYGFLGVDLFFVISGFLIVTLLLRERDKTGGISLRDFYIRRSLRIFPLYYGFILGLAGIYLFVRPNSAYGQQFISELPIYLFYLGNIFPVSFGIVWSLATEEQFYLIWPLLEKYFRSIIFYLLAIALFVNQLINFHSAEITEWLGVHRLEILQATFTPILLGVLLAHLLHQRNTFGVLQKIVGHRFASLAILLLLVLFCFLMPADISGLPRLTIHILMMLLLASIVINEKTLLLPALSNRFIARIGVISYGIYLFHIHALLIAGVALERLGIYHELLLFVVAYLLVILIAELSYRLYEMPFLRLKARFSAVHQQHS